MHPDHDPYSYNDLDTGRDPFARTNSSRAPVVIAMVASAFFAVLTGFILVVLYKAAFG